MDSLKQYLKLRDMVLKIEPEVRKVMAGNKAAGRRSRKTMMEVIKMGKEIRKTITEELKDD